MRSHGYACEVIAPAWGSDQPIGAMRYCWRARLKARQQLKALLLRHGHRYSGKSSWTAAPWDD